MKFQPQFREMGSIEHETDNMCFWSRTNFPSILKLAASQNALTTWIFRALFWLDSDHVLVKRRNINISRKTWIQAMWSEKISINCSKKERKLELIWPKFSTDSLLSFISTWRFFLMVCEQSCELLSNKKTHVTCWVLQTYNKHQRDHASTHTSARRLKNVYKIPQRPEFSFCFVSRLLN